MKLVGGPPRYANSVGQSRSFGNWHRLARNLPSEEQEADLRRDLTGLEAARREEAFRLLKTEQERRIAIERQHKERKAGIEKQIQELVTQSFIGGFIPLGLQTTSILLKKDERVVWETAAFRLKQRTSNGVPFWDSDGAGILVVTDQRVIFRADTGAMWSKPVTKLLSVNHEHIDFYEEDDDVTKLRSANHEYIRDQGICVLWIDGQQKPVAFGGVQSAGTVSIGGVMYPIQLTSHELREVIQSRCGG